MHAQAAIGDHALIGDGRSAALVTRDGAIDWLCWPRFDSPAVFAAILDAERGGRWRIAPREPFRATRRYLPDSCVLVTTFETDGGVLTLTDLMTVASEQDKRRELLPEHELLRVASCSRGEVELELEFDPRPGYAARTRPLRDRGLLGLRLEDGRHLYTLRAEPDPSGGEGAPLPRRLRLRAGQHWSASLCYDAEGPAVLPPLGLRAFERLCRTAAWWRQWARRCRYHGPHRAQVIRSALTLKLLSHAPSGAIIAAPTTSLPERVGGTLNWDYRFCWLRDAALTVRALFDLGYEDEAAAFVSWLLHSTRLTRPELRVLYDVNGNPPGREQILPHLRGHRDSRPVRIRNGASTQLQLDTYGEVIDAVAEMARRGLPLDRETRTMLWQFGGVVCKNWHRPDQGIWEPRQPPEHHTHSLALCWVALDRLLELHARGLLPEIDAGQLTEQRRRIQAALDGPAWNPELGSFTDTLNGDTVDASLLLLGWYRVLPPEHARLAGTFRLIEERLQPAPGLLYRSERSRADGEGCFAICAFWAVEHMAREDGSLAAAEARFRRLLGFANDLGLFAEQVDPASGEALGNFPQAFTHVGLLSAAVALERAQRRQEAARAEASAGTHSAEAAS
jgi:GH15 family glucan-1,4-alpha-glucosidase